MSDSNIETSELVGFSHDAGDSDETSFEKTRVLYIHDPTRVDQWVRPFFKAAFDQAIWKSLPVVSRIIGDSQMSSDSVRGVYNGAHHLDSCSQMRVFRPQDLEEEFSTVTAKK
jgi:hypothetical protein